MKVSRDGAVSLAVGLLASNEPFTFVPEVCGVAPSDQEILIALGLESVKLSALVVTAWMWFTPSFSALKVASVSLPSFAQSVLPIAEMSMFAGAGATVITGEAEAARGMLRRNEAAADRLFSIIRIVDSL